MKIHEIERLRGIAILLVLFQHLSITPAMFDILGLQKDNMPFYLGVELFFVISGYVVTKSFVAKNFDVKHFYLKRVLRLIPIILFFIGITAFLNIFPTFFSASWNQFGSEATSILFGIYTLLPTNTVKYNAAMWSLSIEEQFYLTFSVLLLLSNCLFHQSRASQILWLVFLYFGINVSRYLISYHSQLSLPDVIKYAANYKFDFLILGVLLYYLHSWKPLVSRNSQEPYVANYMFILVSCLLILLSLTLSYYLGSGLGNHSQPLYTTGYFLIGLCFFVLVSIAALDQGFINFGTSINRFFEYLGSRSYGIYVLHYPVFVIVWMCINAFFRPIFYTHPFWYGSLQLLLVTLFGIPIIEIAHRFVEKPFIRLSELLSQKYFTKSDAPPTIPSIETLSP